MALTFSDTDTKASAALHCSGGALAFLGDAVYELLVRRMLLEDGNRPQNDLHRLAVNYVKCGEQAKIVKLLLPMMTEDEESIYKRGRNSHSSRIPKNADVIDYRQATGLEALFGYLYLTNQHDRILEYWNIIIKLTTGDNNADYGDNKA